MTTIVTRVGKGSPLTWTEVDTNFTNLNSAKYESGNNATLGTIQGSTITATTSFSGALNGTVGATTPAAGTFTSLSDSGNLTFTGTGNRITGDFTATTNSVLFQTSVSNSATYVSSIPNGTNTFSGFLAWNDNSASASAAWGGFYVNGGGSPAFNIVTDKNASGTYMPMRFQTGGSERMRIDTSGNVGIGTSSPSAILHLSQNGNTTAFIRATNSGTNSAGITLENAGQRNWQVWADRSTDTFRIGNNSRATTNITLDSSGNVGIGTASPSVRLQIEQNQAAYTYTDLINATNGGGAIYRLIVRNIANSGTTSVDLAKLISSGFVINNNDTNSANYTGFGVDSSERMRIDSSGNVLVGTTTSNPATTNGTGATLEPSGVLNVSRNTEPSCFINRKGNDGGLVNFYQDGTLEGSISVSGTTVSYNGGHISRWSQLYNETEKVEVYRGSVLESVDAMCEWYNEEGNLLPNEQCTKTIVSTSPASKAVAGVFDRYDEDDEDNPYDFYVAQSGDFVIRLAAGTVVQNGDLLESAGDGTARVQADDICRSSTIAKVTSNYVSETYADGSFCVPCILMIG